MSTHVLHFGSAWAVIEFVITPIAGWTLHFAYEHGEHAALFDYESGNLLHGSSH
jgi:hypothetical protein